VARRTASIILSVVFALLALAAWGQVLSTALGHGDDPHVLTALHACTGAAAAATAWGSWRRAKWTSSAAVAYGIVTAGMLIALPSLLRLPAAARTGIWTGAVAVLVFAALCAMYFRSDARRHFGGADPSLRSG
jgi:hypothetical protein